MDSGGDFLRLLLAANPTSTDVALLAVGSVTAVAAGLPYPLLGLLFGRLLDDLNQGCGEADPAALSKGINDKVFYVACVAVANFVLIWTYTGAWTLFGERLAYRLKLAYLGATLRQDQEYFDSQPTGSIVTRLDVDIQAIQAGTSEKVGIYMTSLSYFVTAYIIAFAQDFKLTLIMSVLIPLYFASSLLGNFFTKRYSERVTRNVEQAMSLASESLTNMPILVAFNIGGRLEDMFHGHLKQAMSPSVGKFFTAACQLGFLYFVAYASNALAIWQGSQHIADALAQGDKGFSFGNIYTVILLLLDASFIFTQVSPFLTMFATATEKYHVLRQVIDRKPAIDGSAYGETTTGRGTLALEQVDFSYPSRLDTPILKQCSLEIADGKITAVVGASGSGKSTIALLLARLYDPRGGAITLDGIDLRQFSLQSLRQSVAFVEQDPTLFDTSILENVAYGLRREFSDESEWPAKALTNIAEAVRSGASMDAAVGRERQIGWLVDKVRHALALAEALPFVEKLDHGLATKAGPKGRQLSGGQRQRIAIARALVRSSNILVMDEATSALDSSNEFLILQNLKNDKRKRTVLFITHRISTIKDADVVVAMDKGRVVESGPFNELMLRDGLLKRLASLQIAQKDKTRQEPSEKSQNTNEGRGPLPEKDELRKSVDSEADTELDTESLLSEADRLLDADKSADGSKTRKLSQAISYVGGRILELSGGHRRFIVVGAVLAVLVGLSHTIEGLLMGNTVDKVNICQPQEAIRSNGVFYGILFLCAGIAELGANIFSSSALAWVAENVLLKSRVLSFRSLASKDVQWHESKSRSPDKLLALLEGDTASLSGITGNVLGISLSVIVSLVAGIIISHIIAWRIAIVLLATVPLMLGSGYMRLVVIGKFQAKYREALVHSVTSAKEAVDNIYTVALYGLEQEMLELYIRALAEPYNAAMRTALYGNVWLALSYSMSNAIYAFAYWWGARNILDGYYTQAQFFTVLPALLIGAQGAGQLFSMVPDISRASVAAANVIELIDSGPLKTLTSVSDSSGADQRRHGGYQPIEMDELESPNDTAPDPAPRAAFDHEKGLEVDFRDVQFAYPSRPDTVVLQRLSLNISAGSFAALVGSSGSGKSTVLSLAERFYTASSGTVRVGGANVTSDTGFRQHTAFVPQNPMLFDGSVEFNVSLGSETPASRAAVEDACKLAHIHDTIVSLPEGYDTRVGVNGSLLSGGQRQRLAIARALIRKPRLMLLDEPTSALDAESEKAIQLSLQQIHQAGATMVVVAHRLATIRQADVIFLVEEGTLVDQGRHERLLETNELYRERVLQQVS